MKNNNRGSVKAFTEGEIASGTNKSGQPMDLSPESVTYSWGGSEQQTSLMPGQTYYEACQPDYQTEFDRGQAEFKECEAKVRQKAKQSGYEGFQCR